MALDSGQDLDLISVPTKGRRRSSAETFIPSIDAGPDIGAALKAVREFRHLTLEQVAETTCIRRAYLAALEDRRLEALPSRPFTIGYIRAYANALGLDGEAAVRRFKADEPLGEEPLRGPIGVDHGRDPRLVIVGVAGAMVIAAIAIWNIAQRAMTEEARPAAPAAAAVAPGPVQAAKSGPLALGAPLPAPVESTTPAPYETPGLEAAAAANGSADASIAAAKSAAAAAKVTAAPVPTEALPPTFVAAGAVYGAEPKASIVTLQARKAASLIVRGPDGSVYFARQLAAGEAYRAPTLAGLTADVSDPAAIQVFVGGQTRGLLPAAQTPIAKLSAAN